jgi:hypothetical protein
VANVSFVMAAVLAFAFLCTEAMGQVPGGPPPDLKTPFVGSPLACTPTQSEKIIVPKPVFERDKLRVRLLNLLRESLYDDAKGIVNIAREKEIKKLASKLKNAD